jgi:hypothetical protein
MISIEPNPQAAIHRWFAAGRIARSQYQTMIVRNYRES